MILFFLFLFFYCNVFIVMSFYCNVFVAPFKRAEALGRGANFKIVLTLFSISIFRITHNSVLSQRKKCKYLLSQSLLALANKSMQNAP